MGIEPWLGACHLVKGWGARQENYNVQVAVFCDGRDTFEKLLRTHIQPQGYRLLWAEEVLSATSWLSKHGYDGTAASLARAVHPQHRVELGPLRVIGEDGEPPPLPSYLTITEHSIEPLPDQTGIPFWDQEWIAPELKELLFGSSEGKETELKTYFIVDAALRKKITGFFDLDPNKIDIPFRCLFKGEAAQELKQYAPYLMDMTLPEGALEDRDLVPDFHKDFFKKHWEQGTGIFIRSKASFEDTWRHFRKFTKYKTREGRSFFFRFWETNSLYDYYSQVALMPDRAKGLFLTKQNHFIEAIIGYAERLGRLHKIAPNKELLETAQITEEPFVITQPEEQALMAGMLRPYAIEIQKNLLKKQSEMFSQIMPEDMEAIILYCIFRMNKYGIYNMDYLEAIAMKEFNLGLDFETRDPKGVLLDICHSNQSEDAKFSQFMKRLEQGSSLLTSEQ